MTTVATTIPAIWVALFRQAERITSDAHNDNDRSRANNVGVALMLRALSSPDLWSEVSHGYASDSVGEHAEDTFAIADHVKRVRGNASVVDGAMKLLAIEVLKRQDEDQRGTVSDRAVRLPIIPRTTSKRMK